MFWVYIIESEATGRWYYGHTNQLLSRLKAHNTGWNVSTKGRGPWRYIFHRGGMNLCEAVAFEKELKLMKNRSRVVVKYGKYFLVDKGSR